LPAYTNVPDGRAYRGRKAGRRRFRTPATGYGKAAAVAMMV
jgi:hypothetical protein